METLPDFAKVDGFIRSQARIPEHTVDICGRGWIRAAGRRVGLERGVSFEVQVQGRACRQLIAKSGTFFRVVLPEETGTEEN